MDSGEDNADMWATADETSESITGLYRRATAHADETIDALPLDATGAVAWWPPERRSITLHLALVHMVAETHRHAGHADLARELVDGAIGRGRDIRNAPAEDESWWVAYHARVDAAARAAAGRG